MVAGLLAGRRACGALAPGRRAAGPAAAAAPSPSAATPCFNLSGSSRRPRRAAAAAAAGQALAATAAARPAPGAVDSAAPAPAGAAAVSLTPSASAAGVSPLPLERQPLFRPERFEEVYSVGEVLGNGTYGVVRTCTHRQTGEQFAVKILQCRRNKVDRTAVIENEAAMADRVRWCRSVAQTLAVHSDAYSVYIIQELLVGGNLQALLDSQGPLSEAEAAAAFRGVLEALAACHSEGICYGDVKPGNFMLASLYPSVLHLADPAAPKGALDVRMVDFGCAQACPDEYSLEGLSGTPVYMAPEVAAGHQYGPASDLWGAGIMLYQLLTGRFPYWDCDLDTLRTMPMSQVLADVRSGAVALDSDTALALSPGARDLLAALLEVDPERRISAHDALRHSWVAGAGAQ